MTDARRAAEAYIRPVGGSSSAEPGRGGVPRWVALAPMQLTLAAFAVAWAREERLVADVVAVAAALLWILGVTAFVLLAVVMARREPR